MGKNGPQERFLSKRVGQHVEDILKAAKQHPKGGPEVALKRAIAVWNNTAIGFGYLGDLRRDVMKEAQRRGKP